ncbi:MAG: hypothetical protein LQ337_007726 [Flavoplaca oasis]|nr:MAG: hypothetical protein LQ337_007726 [Flavoplaca oasis]
MGLRLMGETKYFYAQPWTPTNPHLVFPIATIPRHYHTGRVSLSLFITIQKHQPIKMIDAASIQPSNPSTISIPIRKIHYPTPPPLPSSQSSQKKKISRFFPFWHPDVLAARIPTSTTQPRKNPTPNDAANVELRSEKNTFTPITVITTITSITTVTSLSPLTTTTVITDVTNTTMSPASASNGGGQGRKWQRRKNGKGLRIDIADMEMDVHKV